MTVHAPTTGRARFLAACRGDPTDATPVWFMRQAGRCLADYRALRERYAILEIAKTPELAGRVALMPVEQLGVDGAVLFADIMLPLEGMGVSLEIQPEVGPIVHHPIRTMADVERLRVAEPEESVPFVLETIRLIRAELGERAAVIGFAGAPFTLACYLIEGRPSRDYAQAKALMYRQPDVWAALMEKLTGQMTVYLRAQIAAGADVVQLFDSWVGALGPGDFARYVLPWSRRIFDGVRGPAPTIYFGTGTAGLLELIAQAGSDLVSVDWRVPLDEAWARIGLDRGIQGNLDPIRPLAGWAAAEEGMKELLGRAGGRPGHVFNLGHGVMPETDPDVLRRLVDRVHEETRR
ncbi:MAG TPA: uroporphyrinogen decarboxylase [Chloroflexota bacterium]|nr:uroporphyrinogen decarboxylase [Chloroflexota bacterium]